MASFSKSSLAKLETCDPRIKSVMLEVVRGFDCTIICGHRGEEEQNKHFNSGNSKLRYPNSKHNKTPSIAVDVAPYPIDWNDTARFRYFAGYVRGVAAMMGVRLRWGGDWDMDNQLSDNGFNDLVHFELTGE